MKKFVIIMAVALIAALTLIPVYAEVASVGDAGEPKEENEEDAPDGAVEEITSDVLGTSESSEDAERFNEIMTELYEYWQNYTETEGDNGFEKAVNFAWKYRGDIGGVAAAIAIVVFLLVMVFRFMPCMKRYFDYIYRGNAETKNEIVQVVDEKISKYAPALCTVETVAEMYPKLKELFEALISENIKLEEMVTAIGERVAETEQKHALEMRLQGETFRDIITLSALPVGKKNDLLEKYRLIENGEYTSEGDETV